MQIKNMFPLSTRTAVAVDSQGDYYLTDGKRFVVCSSFQAALDDETMKRKLFFGEEIEEKHVS